MQDRKPVILDSNSIIYAVRNHVNLELELKIAVPGSYPVIPECVISELRGLSRTNMHARTALSMSSRFEAISSEGKGDDCILKLASNTGWPVLTNDRELTRRLKEAGTKVYLVKERRYIGEAR